MVEMGINPTLLQEMQHRCSNDLQLVVSLIELSKKRTDSEKTASVLTDLGNRVRVLAQARSALLRSGERDLATALREVCESLQVLAEPKSVAIQLTINDESFNISEGKVLAASLAVNELVTNALKHAYQKRDGGRIAVNYSRMDSNVACISVEDDGDPFAFDPGGATGSRGLGLGLVRRLIDQQGGMLIAPTDGSKRFELRIESKVPTMAVN